MSGILGFRADLSRSIYGSDVSSTDNIHLEQIDHDLSTSWATTKTLVKRGAPMYAGKGHRDVGAG